MNVGRYSAQPVAVCGVPVEVKFGMKDAEGEFWTESDGPAAEGSILSNTVSPSTV